MRKVLMYTDGSCAPQTGPGGWAVLIKDGEETIELSGNEVDTTSYRAELMAVVHGLEAISSPACVTIYSDTKYIVNGLRGWFYTLRNNKWKTEIPHLQKTLDLWKRLNRPMHKHRVKTQWVQAHNNHPENEWVDSVARLEKRKIERELIVTRGNLPND